MANAIGKTEAAGPKAKLLLVGASPRKGGNSDRFIGHFAGVAEAMGVEVEAVFLRDLEISPCVGCERCRKDGRCTRFDDGMTPLYESISQAQGLLLVSPVHNYNITAWMKAFIDRLYCYYEFEMPRPGPWSSMLAGQGRNAVVAAIAEQNELGEMGFALEAMSMPLEALGYEVVSKVPLLGIFERGKLDSLPDYLAEIKAQAEGLVGELNR